MKKVRLLVPTVAARADSIQLATADPLAGLATRRGVLPVTFRVASHEELRGVVAPELPGITCARHVVDLDVRRHDV